MRKRTCMVSVFTLSTAMFFGSAAMAADMPKEGTDSFTNTWILTPSSPLKVGDRTLGTFELNGIHRNDNREAMMTNMGLRCLGIYEIVGTGPEQEHGACTFTDQDGDQIMGTFDRKTESGGIGALVAGTGKFTGISGISEWTTLYYPVRAEANDKLRRGVGAETVHWKLP